MKSLAWLSGLCLVLLLQASPTLAEAANTTPAHDNYPAQKARLETDIRQAADRGSNAQYLKALERLRQLALAHHDQDTALLMRVKEIFQVHDHKAMNTSLQAMNKVRSQMRSNASLALREAVARVYGNLYIDTGNFELALQHQLEALQLEASLPHDSLQARLYRLGTISELYTDMQLPDKALQYADRGLRLATGPALRGNRVSLLAARTLAQIRKGDYAQAGASLHEAEQLNRQSPGDFSSTRLLAIRASLQLAREQYDKATQTIAALQTQATRTDNRYYAIQARLLRGQLMILLGKVSAGSTLMQEAIAEYRSLGQTVGTLDGLQRMISALRARQDWKRLAMVMQQQSDLWLKLYRSGQMHAIAESQARYDAMFNEKRIANLDNRLTLQIAQRKADRRLLLLIACLALLAIASAIFLLQSRQRTRKERDSLSRAVRHDPLTGALSRYAFELHHGHLSPEGRRNRAHAVLLLDLDEFKSINDGHGHDAGDAILCSVVNRILGQLQKGDQLYRWGGEEFVLMYAPRPVAELQRTVRELLASIAGLPHSWQQQNLAATVSGGLVLHPLSTGIDSLVSDTLRWADAALYAAKQAGRKRVVQVSLTAAGQTDLRGRRPIDVAQLRDWERHGLIELTTLQI